MIIGWVWRRVLQPIGKRLRGETPKPTENDVTTPTKAADGTVVYNQVEGTDVNDSCVLRRGNAGGGG